MFDTSRVGEPKKKEISEGKKIASPWFTICPSKSAAAHRDIFFSSFLSLMTNHKAEVKERIVQTKHKLVKQGAEKKKLKKK